MTSFLILMGISMGYQAGLFMAALSVQVQLPKAKVTVPLWPSWLTLFFVVCYLVTS